MGDTKQQGRMYYPLPFSFHQTQGYYRFVVRLQRHPADMVWVLFWVGFGGAKNKAREVGAVGEINNS